MDKFVSKSESETKQLAHKVVDRLVTDGPKDRACVVGLYGELGSGKTTFTKYFAQSLGVKDTVHSPTFVIMKSFNLDNLRWKKLYHLDAYRIENEKEMINFGWDEIVNDPHNIVVVEWPERVSGLMPAHSKIFFEHLSPLERGIRLEL